MRPITYLALGCLLLSSVLQAFNGNTMACALYACLALALLDRQRIVADRERLMDQLEIARDEVRTQRVGLSQARSKLRTLEQSDDHEAAIGGHSYPVPPPLPPPPASSSHETDRLRQRWKRRRLPV